MSKIDMEWEKIGEVGVDSGMILITDPHYIKTQWEPGEPDPTIDLNRLRFESVPPQLLGYDGCRKLALSRDGGGQLIYREGHAGAGVVVKSGDSDGVFGVYVKRKDDLIVAVKVELVITNK